MIENKCELDTGDTKTVQYFMEGSTETNTENIDDSFISQSHNGQKNHIHLNGNGESRDQPVDKGVSITGDQKLSGSPSNKAPFILFSTLSKTICKDEISKEA